MDRSSTTRSSEAACGALLVVRAALLVHLSVTMLLGLSSAREQPRLPANRPEGAGEVGVHSRHTAAA